MKWRCSSIYCIRNLGNNRAWITYGNNCAKSVMSNTCLVAKEKKSAIAGREVLTKMLMNPKEPPPHPRPSQAIQSCPTFETRHFPNTSTVTKTFSLDILSTVHLRIIYFSLFPTWYTVFPSTYTICYPLSSTSFRPHRPIILSQRPHDKDICREGEYHRLHVQFRPPDDGPVRPETCRGKTIADSVRRRKNSVSSWK